MSNGIEKRIATTLEKAYEIIVGNQKTLTMANNFLLGVTELLKEIDNHHDPIIKLAKETHLRAVRQKRILTDPLERTRSIVKPRIAEYLLRQRQIQREQEEARRRTEMERKRLEEEALRKAQEAEQLGNNNEAEKILEDAAKEEQSFEPMPVVQEKPKVSGLSVRQNWKFRITNLELLCRERPDLMVPNEVMIGKLIRITKDQTNIPGIEVYCEDNLAVRI